VVVAGSSPAARMENVRNNLERRASVWQNRSPRIGARRLHVYAVIYLGAASSTRGRCATQTSFQLRTAHHPIARIRRRQPDRSGPKHEQTLPSTKTGGIPSSGWPCISAWINEDQLTIRFW